jgi:hypothetical protein
MTSLPEFNCSKWDGCKIKDSAFRELETVSDEVPHRARPTRPAHTAQAARIEERVK